MGAVIEAYVRTARPVASQELVRDFDFGLSPATLRNELLELDEQGYVEQPHTSSGRIPTDLGYRFFVDHLLPDDALLAREREPIRAAFGIDGEEDFTKALSRAVSRASGMFTAAGLAEDSTFYETGFSEILREPEFEDRLQIRAFGRLADMMDEEIRRMLGTVIGAGVHARIFIGRENPWKEARDYAMALSLWQHPRGFRGFVVMVGPKRTDYQKHKAILEVIAQFHE